MSECWFCGGRAYVTLSGVTQACPVVDDGWTAQRTDFSWGANEFYWIVTG